MSLGESVLQNDISSLLQESKRVGRVLEVTSTGAKIWCPCDFEDGSESAPVVRPGDFLAIESREAIVLAQVQSLRGEWSSTGSDTIEAVTVHTKMIASFNRETKSVGAVRALHVVSVGDIAYPANSEFAQFMLSNKLGLASSAKQSHALKLGTLANEQSWDVSVLPEHLFGRHIAILGTTGGGKSWTTAKIVEECLRFDSKVILFDATGEYGDLDNGVIHAHLGDVDPAHPDASSMSLPFYHLMENDLFAMFKPSGASQAPKLRAAMHSLKLARLAPNIAVGGMIMKAHRPKVEYLREYQRNMSDVESPFATFDIELLTKQIDNECCNPQSSAVEPMVWGGPSPIDQANCVPLISRIQDIIHSPGLAPIFQPGDRPALFDELENFFSSPLKRVFCLSLRNLSHTYGVREIIANAIGRRILEWGREGRFTQMPVLTMVDEAHQFLGDIKGGEDSPWVLNSFALLAKEGRKYGLNICLATQRPRDIPEGVLSQMGTLMVHRLVNDLDRQIIERASGELDAETLNLLPTLSPGEALLSGVSFPMPILVKVGRPSNPPNSSGPNFQACWKPKSRVVAKA